MCGPSSSYLGGPTALAAVRMLTLHTLLLLGSLLIWNNTASDVVNSAGLKSEEFTHKTHHTITHTYWNTCHQKQKGGGGWGGARRERNDI